MDEREESGVNERDVQAAKLQPLVFAIDEPGPNRDVRRVIVARLQNAQRRQLVNSCRQVPQFRLFHGAREAVLSVR